jgi:acyl transferase domain-containing protein
MSLEGNIDALLQHIENSSPANMNLPALSYTTTARRIHHMFRVMVSGSTIADIKAQLIAAKDEVHVVHRVRTAPRVIFAFTGQGSQYSGMGRELYKNFSSFRYDLDRYDQLAQNLGFPSFVQAITDSCRPLEDYSPVVIQIATTCLEMALGHLWESWGVTPRAVVGHSLGEYAALHIAGVLSECDTIYLVGQRAMLLQEYCTPNTHSMLAVKASFSVVQSFLAGSGCEIATINGPEDTVLSGENRKVNQIQDVLTSKNIKSTFLKVPYAFHSSQVEPILQELDLTASKVTVSDPKIPIICGTNASIVKESTIFNCNYFSTHCRQPVNMLGAIQSAKQEGMVDEACVMIEIGPQPIVSKMISSILKMSVNILTLLQNGVDTWKLLGSALTTLYTRGVDIHWREYNRDFHSSQRVLELPSYSWELKNYWIQYKNDWSLYKGEAPNGGFSSSKAAKIAPLQTLQEPVLQKLESTTIHRILEENMDSRSGKLVIEADISRSDLNPLVKGHKVNGIPLCTPVRFLFILE